MSFDLNEGEVLSIIGSSGNGKTTLLRCLNFLERADGGTITLRGNLIYDGEVQKKIKDKELRETRLHFGLVFQSFNLFPQYWKSSQRSNPRADGQHTENGRRHKCPGQACGAP